MSVALSLLIIEAYLTTDLEVLEEEYHEYVQVSHGSISTHVSACCYLMPHLSDFLFLHFHTSSA